MNSNHELHKQKILVQIPPRPPYEYKEVPQTSPIMSHLKNGAQDSGTTGKYQAQIEGAELAFQKFQNLLGSIFHDLEQLQSNLSAGLTIPPSSYFEDLDLPDDSTLRLHSNLHSKLQNAIKKLTQSGKFKEVPTDDVKRLQDVCEGPIVQAQNMNLRPMEEDHEEDVARWQINLSKAENALTAACTLSWTIRGSLERKEHCSEDLVQNIPVLLTNVFETCLIPVLEARPSGRYAGVFRHAIASKQLLTRLLHQARKLLSLVTDISFSMERLESAITRIEYLTTQLIFAETSTTEKDSALGVQVFETVRKTAMDVLAKIFFKFSDQRQSILDEILSSLQKLSTTKQGARQFKLMEGKSIQLVSALVMNLVQTVACDSFSETQARQHDQSPHTNREQEGALGDDHQSAVKLGPDRRHESSPTYSIGQTATSLYQKAIATANYIINYFVQRAKVSSKTGDQPHRNLLDLFTGDLISVIGFPEWPAAELLLWILARHMLAILNDEKSVAVSKNMALEVLGWMGSAITNLIDSIRPLWEAFDKQADPTGQYLSDLARDQGKGLSQTDDLLTETGPFRLTLEYLSGNDNDNLQFHTAHGYYLVVWAQFLSSHFGDEKLEQPADLRTTLSKASTDPTWLAKNSVFERVTAQHAKLAYLTTLMDMNFCKTFDVIVNVLLHSLTSDQAKIRSRSLKSVIAMLEADPKLLDRDAGIMKVMFKCTTDSSPMVRDNALSLIAKGMTLRPTFELEATRVVLERGQSDPATAVRKRCIAILKDLYLRTSDTATKADIARSLLYKLSDTEETVALLAEQALVETWIQPFVSTTVPPADSARSQVALNEQAHLLVKTVNAFEGGSNSDLLAQAERFFSKALENKQKDRTPVFQLCSSIVDYLFDHILNDSDTISKQEQRALLCTIQTLVKADHSLVKPENLQALQPYIQNLSSDDDLFFFRSVVVIYHHVLPFSSDNLLLKAVQNDLMRAISKLGRAELNEAVACLWTIDRRLRNTERLVKLTISLLKNIEGSKSSLANGVLAPSSTLLDTHRRLRSYLRITGCMGKHCDLESSLGTFRAAFPTWKGGSVAGLLIDLITPLSSPNSPAEIRLEALHSLASICQSWPGQFNRESVRHPISEALAGGSSELQLIVLVNFLEFFKAREIAAEKASAAQDPAHKDDSGRLESSLQASDHDGAAALIAQHFLTSVRQLALSGHHQIDHVAAEIIASVSRQGLVHPKECAGALVALETSPRSSLSRIACDSHQLLHQRHETMFEREYVRAIRGAFLYQKDVVGDPLGASSRPFSPKLAHLYEMVKTSNVKYVRKFLRNIIGKICVDMIDAVSEDEAVDHVLFSRFILQNLAFFEYGKVDEIVHVIAFVESHVGKLGAEVAQAIEGRQIQRENGEAQEPTQQLQNPSRVLSPGAATAPTAGNPAAGEKSLRLLTTAAMTLTMLWELRTHLRRQYGITEAVQESNGKGKDVRELTKAPIKVHGITGERFWDQVCEIMTSLDTEATMLARCHAFQELMTVDDEVKIAARSDEMGEFRSVSVERESSLQPSVDGGRRMVNGKRKTSSSVTSTPKKKRGRPSLQDKRRNSDHTDCSEDGFE